MTRLEIIEYIEEKRRTYRTIGYALMNGDFWSKEDVEQLLDKPDELKKHFKGNTRSRLIQLAKDLKIKDYSRKTVVQLMELIDEKQRDL